VVVVDEEEEEEAPTVGEESEDEVAEEEETVQSVAHSGEQLVATVAQLLQLMLDQGASDLHLSSHQQVRMRADGALQPLEEFAAPLPEWLEQIIGDILPDRNREEFERRHDTDFAYGLDDLARFRVNVFRDRLGMGAVFRVIPSVAPSFDELALPPSLREVAQLRKGLVLVTGPTGSGKSTTLAALIDLINRERNDHIITIEDPIEFVHESKGCLVHQREFGIHTESFARALMAALREDPDVVLVGVMKDLDTVSLALETAETGHLVFGTLHTATAQLTIERLINQYPVGRQAQIRMMVSECLHSVIAQTLVKRKGGGRVAAHEILVNTDEVAQLIREDRTSELTAVLEKGAAGGMSTLNDGLMRLVDKGLVEPRDAWLESRQKADFEKRLKAGGYSLEDGPSGDVPVDEHVTDAPGQAG
jgi:twitching motility protein PilT